MNGAPCETQTHGLECRKFALYSTELRKHGALPVNRTRQYRLRTPYRQSSSQRKQKQRSRPAAGSLSALSPRTLAGSDARSDLLADPICLDPIPIAGRLTVICVAAVGGFPDIDIFDLTHDILSMVRPPGVEPGFIAHKAD